MCLYFFGWVNYTSINSRINKLYQVILVPKGSKLFFSLDRHTGTCWQNCRIGRLWHTAGVISRSCICCPVLEFPAGQSTRVCQCGLFVLQKWSISADAKVICFTLPSCHQQREQQRKQLNEWSVTFISSMPTVLLCLYWRGFKPISDWKYHIF